MIYLDNIKAIPHRASRTSVTSEFSGSSVLVIYPEGVISDVRDDRYEVQSKRYEHPESLLPHSVAMRHNIVVTVNNYADPWWVLSSSVRMPPRYPAPLYPFLLHVYSRDLAGQTNIDNPVYRFRWNMGAWSDPVNLPCGNQDDPATYRGYSRNHMGAIVVSDARAGARLDVQVGFRNKGSLRPRINRVILLMGFA